jgi:uncharacterized protein (TIGR02285 family)
LYKTWLLSLLLFVSTDALCQSDNRKVEKDTVQWGVGHQPPRVILGSGGVIEGQGGIQQRLLEEGLGEYYHSTHVTMNWARMEGEMRNGKKLCVSFLMKNADREQYMTFSLPWHIDLPHRIVMNKDTWTLLNKPAQLSLKSLARDPRLRGVIGNGRSYGNLDPLLQRLDKGSNLFVVSTGPINGLNMLIKGRMDYVIEFSYYVEHFIQQNNLNTDDLVSVPISEAGDYNFVYVGCPKNPWGEQVVEKVNQVIKEVRSRESYKELLKMLYHSEAERKDIEKIYYESFISAS